MEQEYLRYIHSLNLDTVPHITRPQKRLFD